MTPSPPPVASPPRAYRRGFWRLALLAWLAGVALLLWLPNEPLLAPLENVCTTDDAYDYVECRLEPTVEKGVLDRMTAYLGAEPVVDVARVVPRWTTIRHRETLRTLGTRQLVWAAAVWVPFYLLVWAFAGFRPR